MSEVTEGIKRRLESVDQFRDGTYDWLDEILAKNGLPLINSHAGGFDSDYIGFLYEVAELLERITDATNADSMTEATFFERQIDWMIYRARQRWLVSK